MIRPRNNVKQTVTESLESLGETLTSFIRHNEDEPRRWVVALADDSCFLLIEIIFENGGIVGGILENNGIKPFRASRIMNDILNRLRFED